MKIEKLRKRMKHLQKGHKVYKTIRKNAGKFASVVEMVHKAVIK